MTRRGWSAAGMAGVISVGLHTSGLIALAPPEPRMLAGGPAQLAMIGNSFEDAVAGTLTGTTEPERVEPTEVTPTRPPPSVTAQVTEPVTPPITPTVMDPTTPSAERPAPVPVAEQATAAQPVPAATSASPVAAPVLVGTRPVVSATTSVARPDRVSNPSPMVTPEAASIPTPETVTARDGPVARTPDADTPRPRPRVARPATPPREAPVQTARPEPAGTAPRTTRAGDAQGAAQGMATRTQQGAGGEAASDGRAAAQYPQQVNRHLARLLRPTTRFNGAAVVGFTIAGNGGLSGLSIRRSSGNAEFDRLALAHIQRAAPFPAPPPGAQRTFNVTVQGR